MNCHQDPVGLALRPQFPGKIGSKSKGARHHAHHSLEERRPGVVSAFLIQCHGNVKSAYSQESQSDDCLEDSEHEAGHPSPRKFTAFTLPFLFLTGRHLIRTGRGSYLVLPWYFFWQLRVRGPSTNIASSRLRPPARLHGKCLWLKDARLLHSDAPKQYPGYGCGTHF